MIKGIITLLAAAYILSLAVPALAADGGGVIEGHLVNGTEGGGSVATQEIILKTYQDDTEVDSTATRTDTEGSFIFEGLSTESSYSYQATLNYQEADYYSEWLSFNEGETGISTEVIVYDSTTSDEAIVVATSHAVIYIEGGSLQIVENYVFINDSDRTYIGSKEVVPGAKETLKFSLPEGASEPQPGTGLMECCIYPSQNGFVDSMPVYPGFREVDYSYSVSMDAGTYQFSRGVNYPMASFDLLVQGEGTGVTSQQLATEGLLEFNGIFYNHLSGVNFAPGETLVAQLSGLPQSNEQRVVLWASLTLAVLGGGVILSYLVRKKRAQPVRPVEGHEQRQQRLLLELARLDDDFEAGKIPEGNYRQLRQAKKAKLLKLTKGTGKKNR